MDVLIGNEHLRKSRGLGEIAQMDRVGFPVSLVELNNAGKPEITGVKFGVCDPMAV